MSNVFGCNLVFTQRRSSAFIYIFIKHSYIDTSNLSYGILCQLQQPVFMCTISRFTSFTDSHTSHIFISGIISLYQKFKAQILFSDSLFNKSGLCPAILTYQIDILKTYWANFVLITRHIKLIRWDMGPCRAEGQPKILLLFQK